jgi:hypothetical protein
VPRRLARLNLDKSRPGFYDDPAFIAAERDDPTLLEAYAGYVESLPISEQYAERVRATVAKTASFLSARLKEDGRLGACIDMSTAVSRFLERQGVWNYMVTGAVTVSFPTSSRLPSRHFWPMGSGPSTPGAAAAHAWVRAPPFGVVDLTLASQPYADGEERFLPEVVIAENVPGATIELSDLVDPELRANLTRQLRRSPRLDDIRSLHPGLLERIRTLGAREIRHDGTTIRYVACAVTAPDASMEEAKNLILSGKDSIELWREFESSGLST